MVSVIIPVYNVESYLEEAIDSVLNQSYDNLEIIIIDDGSTDSSGQICDNYEKIDERVYVIHQENMGLSAARNAGLDIMTGDAVAFLDSDDAFNKDFIKVLADIMQKEKADVVVCNHTVLNTIDKIKLEDRDYNPVYTCIEQGLYGRTDALCALVEGRLVHSVWNKLYRSELWNNIRFPVGHVYEDKDTIYKIIDKCQAVYILDQSLYLYRKRKGSISNTFSLDNIRDRTLAWSHFASYVEANTPIIFTKKQLKKSKQECINWLIGLYFNNNEKGTEERISNNDIKKIIQDTCDTIRFDNCGIRSRVACLLICRCSWLSRILYMFYFPISKLICNGFKDVKQSIG